MDRRSLLLGMGALSLGSLPEPTPSAALPEPEPFFLLHAPLWQKVEWRQGQLPFPFRVTEPGIQAAIDRVVVAMQAPQLATMPPRKLPEVARQIAGAVEAALVGTDLARPTAFERQWLIAEGICEWVRLNVYYDAALESAPDGERVSRPDTILAREHPGAVCWGFAWLTRDLARVAGLKCDVVNGTYRGLLNPAPPGPNHSIACFLFDGDFKVPADVSSARGLGTRPGVPGIRAFRSLPRRKVGERFVLPRSPEPWELFLAGFHPREDAVSTSFDLQGRHRFTTLSRRQWAERDPRSLIPLAERLEARESSR